MTGKRALSPLFIQLVGLTTTGTWPRSTRATYLKDFVGPLGRPTDVRRARSVAVVGGGVGCAIAYPVAKALHEAGAAVDS